MSAKGLSDEDIRSRIVAIFSTLVADLDADQMSDYLIEGFVITVVQWQEILHRPLTKQGRCRELLNLLLTTKNPKAPSVFLNALERNLQWQWILGLLYQNELLKETVVESNESEDFRSESDRRLEEARLNWEKEKKELLEKQRQLQKENEELQELVDELKETKLMTSPNYETKRSLLYIDLCDVDGDIDGFATNTARNPDTASVARISIRSRKSLGRSYVSGKMHLKIVYTSNLQQLEVTVVDCKGLHKHCDPYVKLYVLPDEAKITKRKTAVKYNTVNPVYIETFTFPLSLSDEVTYTLWVSVWQKFRLMRNKLLGEVVIPLEDDPFGMEVDDWYYLEKKLR